MRSIMKTYIQHTEDEVLGHQLDITAPQSVEVKLSPSGTIVWINVDGICRLRLCRIGDLTLTDERTES